MSTPSIPLISAMPQFTGQSEVPDDLATSSPVLQSLLWQTGGQQNVNSLGASSPQMGQMLSFMSPPGGISNQQAQQFGPLFALLMSMQQGGQQGGPGMAK